MIPSGDHPTYQGHGGLGFADNPIRHGLRSSQRLRICYSRDKDDVSMIQREI
jgi:hypothetical protein